ncbi:MAG: DUF1566 domain-containing protein [Planctomycetaceae bacterium]|nr:MAG: DUF1566 domain-containing protein [Planctomycetaceae bacterium]
MIGQRWSTRQVSGKLLSTCQVAINHVADDGDYQVGLDRAYTLLDSGQYAGTTTLDITHYIAATISFEVGTRQIETGQIAGTVVNPGDANITITATGQAWSPKTIAVAVAGGDSASTVAGKVRTALGLDADISAFFTISGSSANVILTAKTPAADDALMNMASGNGTCTGLTSKPTSTNTRAGDMTTYTIYDTAGLLATIKTGDTIRVHDSTNNNSVFTVATGNNANRVITTEAVTPEAAGGYVILQKRIAPSNNAVLDNVTGLMWRRYINIDELVGPSSNGTIYWQPSTYYTAHPAAADLQMVAASKTLRIVGGAAEAGRYLAGMVIKCAGFANSVNNLAGHVIQSVQINGADLDIVLWTGSSALIDEAAGGSRSITVECQSIFGYIAAMNAANYAGHADWRVPNIFELLSLHDNVNGIDLLFLGRDGTVCWSSTKTTNPLAMYFTGTGTATSSPTTALNLLPVRSG